MVFHIIPVRPNPRETYQKQTKKLCRLLTDDIGRRYRAPVASLLTISGKAFGKKGLSRFRDHPAAKLFLRSFRLDVRALQIMEHLDTIYGASAGEVDHLRGAVAEVLSHFICRKIYSNAEIEVSVQIGQWKSGSIDTAGCSQKRGHCLQTKCSLTDWNAIVRQKSDFDNIEKLTSGKAQGNFVTFVNRGVFYLRLREAGLDPNEYKVLDRSDLLVLEERLAA